MSNNPFMPGGPVPQPAKAKAKPGTPPPPPAAGISNPADLYEVDLTNVTDNFSVPDGKYRMRCTDLEQSVSQSGNPMFIWSFTVVSGPFAGRDFKLFTALTAAAMWKVAECVQALGVGQTGNVVRFKKADVVNRECGAIIEQQEYNGNKRSAIARVIPLTELDAE